MFSGPVRLIGVDDLASRGKAGEVFTALAVTLVLEGFERSHTKFAG